MNDPYDFYEFTDFDPEEDTDTSDDDLQRHHGHRDRIRMQIIAQGLQSLPPRSLLEYLLYHVLPRQDVNALAQSLLDQFDDLRTLFAAGLDDFRNVKGLGECGAQWLAMIGGGMRLFSALDSTSCTFVKNQAQLMEQAQWMRAFLPVPCCVHLLTDIHGILTLRRPLAHSLEWGERDSIADAVDDANSTGACHSYMIVYTHDHRAHPTRYDLDRVHTYVSLLRHSRCKLRDVLFIGPEGFTSMNRLQLIPDPDQMQRVHSYIAADDDELPDRDLKIICPNNNP